MNGVAVRFLCLGTFAVRKRHVEVVLPHPRRARLLIALLLRRGEAVTRESLIDEIWGDAPPATAANALQVHVARLRRDITSWADGMGDARVVTTRSGYAVECDETSLDIAEFEEAARQFRAARDARREEAIGYARRALSLWRGNPFGHLPLGVLGESARFHLLEQKLTIQEGLYDLMLRHDQHRQLVSEAGEQTVRHPYNEIFAGQFMMALSRSGRLVEALEVYHRLRTRLVDEMGVEPSAHLRNVVTEILRHDHPGTFELARTSGEPGEFRGRRADSMCEDHQAKGRA